MMRRSTPEDGDLVIHHDVRDGQHVYILHMSRGAGQYLLRSRDAAIDHASRFSTRYGVEVWLKVKDVYTVLQDLRAPRPPAEPPA